MKKYFLMGLTLMIMAGIAEASARVIPRMIISVENTDDHVQAIAVKRYADELKHRLAGRIDVQFFSNARLFRDKDAVQALEQGKIEMAVPGTWNIAQFEPNVGVFLLPFFYGRPAETSYKVLEGAVGKNINKRLETSLRIKVLGRWIDLGHAHLFGMRKKITRPEDIKGLRVRVAGGVANKLRIQAFGGEPLIVPWPDLPEYMQRGRIDAVLTSYETIKSAKLWEKGIRYAFEDQEYFPQYVPLVRSSFWNKLSPDIQRILTETWEKHVEYSRKQAAEAQARAKNILAENGVEVVVPDPQIIDQWRRALMSMQGDFVKAMNIDPGLVREMTDGF